MAFRFLDPEKPVTITRGHLPHWDQEDATYFITWRTADSIPKNVWDLWRAERGSWLIGHGIDPESDDWRKHLEDLPLPDRKDFQHFSRKLDDEMDAGHGECVLRRPDIADIVAASFQFFDGDRYTLGDFVVMPNHVHLLVGGFAPKCDAATGRVLEEMVCTPDQQVSGQKGPILAGRAL